MITCGINVLWVVQLKLFQYFHKKNKMRKLVFTLATIFQITFMNAQNSDYLIIVHGGAGNKPSKIDLTKQKSAEEALRTSLNKGLEILKNGGTSLDAVIEAVMILEDFPLFNAGRGSVVTANGSVECDASVMYGKDKSAGAVCGIKTVKNPIALAKEIMLNTPHVMLCGTMADDFARTAGLEIVNNEYFVTEDMKRKWVEKTNPQDKKGTVGAVAIDKYGNISAATSTGGMFMKIPGRVGDSPIIGSGNYANHLVGISGTGWGEEYIRQTVAIRIAHLMEFKNLSLNDAAKQVLFQELPNDSGGLIAVDAQGNYYFGHNTPMMNYGVANKKGIIEVKAY
jgi:beta-aspartyl-peptidase (threonine type)